MIEFSSIKLDGLIGKDYVAGSDDCYGIVRSFYYTNFELKLTDYARPNLWWEQGLNLYMENFHKEGFRVFDGPIRDIVPGDLLLVAVHSGVANHAGVFVGYGHNTRRPILHHFNGRRSELTEFKGIFRNAICAHLRHKDLYYVSPVETSNLEDYILPHKLQELHDFQARQSQAAENTSNTATGEGFGS